MAGFPKTTPGTTEGDGSNEMVLITTTVVGAIILFILGILICLFLRRKCKRQFRKRDMTVHYVKSSLNLGTSISTTSIGETNSSSDIGVSTNTDIQGDDVKLDITDALPEMSSGEIFPEPSRKTLSLPGKILHHTAPIESKEGVPSNVDSLVTEVKRSDQPGPKLEHVQREYTYVSEADKEKSSSLPILKDTKRRDLSLKGAKRIFAYRYYGAGGSNEYSRPTSMDSGYQTNTSSKRSSCVLSELDETDFSEQCESPISNKGKLIFPEKKNLHKPTSYGMLVEEDESADDHKSEFKPKKHRRRSRTVSTSTRRVKKNITPEGGVMKLDEAVLRIGAGCLVEDTEITMINDSENLDFKSLVDLDLISAMPSVFEFLPDGLKFLKPADLELTIRLKRIAPDLELFLLRGSYNHNYEKMIWELVADGIDENKTDGVINVKIDGFSVYTFFSAMRGLISRILSHLNYSFTCVAYAFFRRLPPIDKIDFAVVLVSEFVDEYEEKDIKQLKDHLKEGYIKSDKGMAKRVQTDRSLQMHLDFSGIELSPFVFEIDQPQLDSIGYVIDHFKGVSIESPASGNIKIGEEVCDINSEFLWKLKIHENEDDTNENGQSQKPDDEPEVVYRRTKLTRVEITRMSRMVAMDWDSLAGLLDIPYEEREEIRTNYMKYPDSPSKAEKVLNISMTVIALVGMFLGNAWMNWEGMI
ncbi:uncharacterized protein LOC114527015 [Dendronephthya gigantea]|uniref:uncharacterized protein LOC114527015 n=1 Tax=Dendronephthya gigantea TaxID=151771 RepID=UPI001069BA22|nr:uncharacterized protein LOC114527015 [Dendronephthya gigantea]XP_028404383.1 uncharacterized protein LOC114527015 [Dendronephthya gigantea]